jgi:hypothetical protein
MNIIHDITNFIFVENELEKADIIFIPGGSWPEPTEKAAELWIKCCKAFHARRCLMYYSWAYPETEFVVYPVEVQGINKSNWFINDYGIEKVMGELMRCGAQFKEAIPEYVRTPKIGNRHYDRYEQTQAQLGDKS